MSKRLTPTRLQRKHQPMIKKYPVSLHSFRHTFGTRLGEAGASAHVVKQLMGHTSITVSQRYVHKLTESVE